MRRTRVIPLLLLDQGQLMKTTKFKDPRYVGDAVNTARLFNDKAADELMILDVAAAEKHQPADLVTLASLASECFMPLAYGGGLTTLEAAKRVFDLGVEKVVLGQAALTSPQLIGEIAGRFGSQSVVICIDVVRRSLGRGLSVVTRRGSQRHDIAPELLAQRVVAAGAGEIVVQSVDRDGTQVGYDVSTVRTVADAVDVPVIAAGGAGSLEDLRRVVLDGHASAVAVGSMFTFHGRHRAVLVTYPTEETLEELLP